MCRRCRLTQFFLMINNKSLMGTSLPQGNKRIVLNIAMGVALVAATIGAGWSIWSKVQWTGVIAVGIFFALAIIVHFTRSKQD